VLRISVLSRSLLSVIWPVFLLFALLPLSLVFWKPGSSALPWVSFGPCVGLAVLIMARLALTHVEVGRDGVLLKRLGSQRFLPFGAIASIEDRGEDLRFVLASGEELVLRTGKESQIGKDRYVAQCEALVARIGDEIAKRRDVERDEAHAPDARVLLAHARLALGHDRDDARTYRSQALPPIDELWRIVDDPDADETARAAAAVALRAEPDARPRLRVRAEETVSPPLRTLLRVAADEADAADVARALDACARVAPSSRR
jgi:hypothetical protein